MGKEFPPAGCNTRKATDFFQTRGNVRTDVLSRKSFQGSHPGGDGFAMGGIRVSAGSGRRIILRVMAFLPRPFLLRTALYAAGFVCLNAGFAAPVELTIVPTIDGEPLAPGRELRPTRSGERWTVTRLSYLVSELSFLGEDGQWHVVGGDPAWLSLTDQRNRWQIENAPEGTWRALRFSVGLPPKLNDRDPSVWPASHPLNPNVNGLHWSWQGGYIFLALEGRFWSGDEQAKAAPGFAYHIARESFRTTVNLPMTFTVKANTATDLSIEFDVGRVFDGTEPVSFSRDGSSTHSKVGDPLAGKLQRNLATAFHPAPPANRANGPGKHDPDNPTNTETALAVPEDFPQPDLPDDLVLSPARVSLGQRLFHETRLSRSGTLSCTSCHFADRALSDPRRFSAGEQGRTGNRNGMPLFNLAWKPSFFWDGRAPTLRDQVRVPIEDHRELDESLDRVVAKLRLDPSYLAAFRESFGDEAIDEDRLAIALEAFLLTLMSHDSKFDRAQRGQAELTPLEQRGFELFMTEREPRSGQFGGDCFHCHGGSLFTDHQFRNNGLALDPSDPGRGAITGSPLDEGAFMTPSLRNIDLTAPYMHDGRFATLEEVLDHYSEGVTRTNTLDPNLAKHPDGGLGLTGEDKAALIAFLKTLTDDRFARGMAPAAAP